jgi:membrane-associated protease RseP (regulator of RpoE activity)
LNTKVAAAAGVVAKEGAKNPIGGLMGGGGQQIKIKTLEVGGVKAENLPAVIMNHPTVEALSKAMGPCEGIIGYPFFARYRMTIDYQAKEMTFLPSGFEPKDTLGNLQLALLTGTKKKAPSPLAPAAQWGLRVQKDDKDEDAGVNIAEVYEGSPAAQAGLKAGDRLLIVDDRWTDSVADCYSAATAVRPGMTVRVVIRRDKAEQTLKLTVRAGV